MTQMAAINALIAAPAAACRARASRRPQASATFSSVGMWLRGLLLWRVEGDPLTLHLVCHRFCALVAVGRELGGLAGERFELLAELDRLLHGRLLRSPQLRERAAVMDRLAGLERHQHE